MLSVGLRMLVGASALLAAVAFAAAQEAAPQEPADAQNPGFFDQLGRWFDRQVAGMHSVVQGAGRQVQTFGHEAGIAAELTADGAQQAAAAVTKIPRARIVLGHQECAVAANGAPDCISAAAALCRANGFKSGTSVAMTAAVKCPPSVYLAGRSTGPGCTNTTFVSQALCH